MEERRTTTKQQEHKNNKNKQEQTKQLYNCRSDGSIKQHNKFFSDIQSNLREEEKKHNENAEAPPAQLQRAGRGAVLYCMHIFLFVWDRYATPQKIILNFEFQF